MGLDVYHVVLSAKDEDTQEYFYLEELNDFPGFAEDHKAFITEVIETDNFFTVYIFADENAKNKFKENFDYSRHRALLVGSMDRLAEEISVIELSNNLSPDARSVAEDQVDAPWVDDLLSFTTIKYPVGDVTEKVIYWKTIGEQIRGMRPQFYEDFENCKLYFRKSDVLKAANYLSCDVRDLRELKDNFKADFIDNFVEGKSIFFASW